MLDLRNKTDKNLMHDFLSRRGVSGACYYRGKDKLELRYHNGFPELSTEDYEEAKAPFKAFAEIDKMPMVPMIVLRTKTTELN